MDAKKSARFNINRVAMSVMAAALTLTVVGADSAPGGTTNNSGRIPFDQLFFAFEVESPLGSLKEVPIWDELEQMLDNPYAVRARSERGGERPGLAVLPLDSAAPPVLHLSDGQRLGPESVRARQCGLRPRCHMPATSSSR